MLQRGVNIECPEAMLKIKERYGGRTAYPTSLSLLLHAYGNGIQECLNLW